VAYVLECTKNAKFAKEMQYLKQSAKDLAKNITAIEQHK